VNARALLLAACVLGAGIAAVLVALLHGRAQQSVRLAGGPVVTVRSISPAEPQFGDPVVATVEVFVDRRRVQPDALDVRASFAPFTVTSSSRSVRQAGSISIVRITDRLECLVAACVPEGQSRTVRFPRLRVVYPSGTVSAGWPSIRVHARVSAAALRHPMLRVGPVQAHATYRVSPRLLGWVLLAIGLVSALGGLALLLRAVLTSLPRGRRRAGSELDQILRELGNGLVGDPAGSRLALERLARALEPLDEPLSFESRVLAWAPQEPAPEAISDLALRVREVVGR
jgi:hypothetical protein